MKEEAIIKIIRIRNAGEMKYFQVQLPYDAKRIMGIETGLMYVTSAAPPPPDEFQPPMMSFFRREEEDPGAMIYGPFKIEPNIKLGHLSLMGTGRENRFYVATIEEIDMNLLQGDIPTSLLWSSMAWVHGSKREELSIAVNGDLSIIEGWYKDTRIPADVFPGYEQYNLHIYLWIEKCL